MPKEKEKPKQEYMPLLDSETFHHEELHEILTRFSVEEYGKHQRKLVEIVRELTDGCDNIHDLIELFILNTPTNVDLKHSLYMLGGGSINAGICIGILLERKRAARAATTKVQ